jgi:phage terminase large subunit-like protein
MNKIISPIKFFKLLKWIDGQPLLNVIDEYRRKIFMEALYTFDENGDPFYNRMLAGRGKKNWKSADLCLTLLYRFLIWPSKNGSDSFLLANDEGQANDDLKLIKRLIAANPILGQECIVKTKEIEKKDDGSTLAILPAKDIAGAHGKTYLTIAFDEIHEYRNYDLLEALSPDPTRPDALTCFATYNTVYNRPGVPLFDFIRRGREGTDPRMYFSWYQADYTTDIAFKDVEPEFRANPSMNSWGNKRYLEDQRRRLPVHKFRRLHLNMPGMPQGTYLDAEKVMNCVATGRKRLKFDPQFRYKAFVDMSGGSSDDAVLGIGHQNEGKTILDLILSQNGKPPFNPRDAIRKFSETLKEYNICSVEGDHYAGETFRQDFKEHGISYEVCPISKHQLYEALEVSINGQEVEILDEQKLVE